MSEKTISRYCPFKGSLKSISFVLQEAVQEFFPLPHVLKQITRYCPFKGSLKSVSSVLQEAVREFFPLPHVLKQISHYCPFKGRVVCKISLLRCSAGSSAGILPAAARAEADLQPGQPALRARLPPRREA
jgi:hypothetical protein